MALYLLWLTLTAHAQSLPKVSSGRIERIESFPSKYVSARTIDVWLPDGYRTGKRYSVLYMQDGQALFEAHPPIASHAWKVDVTLGRLIAEHRVPETIVVGIFNTELTRSAEYYPVKFLANLPQVVRTRFINEELHGTPLADRYLRFLVEELKPAIDARYLTRPEPEQTFIVGSSRAR